jgi:hypothetical protein
MAEHEARVRAVYDHDNEEPRPTRRRRQVADWGVGEELFDGMPGRRFERRSHREVARQDIPRGGSADGRRTIVIETEEQLPVETREPVEEEFASREEALRAREAHDELWAGDEPFADDEPEAAEIELAGDAEIADTAGGAEMARRAQTAGRAETADRGETADRAETADRGETADRAETGSDGIVRGGVEGRRTVKIGGRPAEFHGPPPRARQRPRRTVHERLGPRPERIAAWAFALGILLIVIAIATANA